MADISIPAKLTRAILQILLGFLLVVALVTCFEVLYVQLQRTGGVDSIAWQYRALLFALWLAVGIIVTLTVLARHWSPLVPATAAMLLCSISYYSSSCQWTGSTDLYSVVYRTQNLVQQ